MQDIFLPSYTMMPGYGMESWRQQGQAVDMVGTQILHVKNEVLDDAHCDIILDTVL